MNTKLSTIKSNIYLILLMILNIVVATIKFDEPRSFNPIPPPTPRLSNLYTFTFAFEIITLGILLFIFIIDFFPKMKVLRLILCISVGLIQITIFIATNAIIGDFITPAKTPLIYAVTAITLLGILIDIAIFILQRISGYTTVEMKSGYVQNE